MKNKRPLCECGKAYRPINYHKDGKTYYRKLCRKCGTKAKQPKREQWQLDGYVKKLTCEKCGFKAKHADQMHVISISGRVPYKTVCLNCEVAIKWAGGWKQGDLTPDAYPNSRMFRSLRHF